MKYSIYHSLLRCRDFLEFWKLLSLIFVLHLCIGYSSAVWKVDISVYVISCVFFLVSLAEVSLFIHCLMSVPFLTFSCCRFAFSSPSVVISQLHLAFLLFPVFVSGCHYIRLLFLVRIASSCIVWFVLIPVAVSDSYCFPLSSLVHTVSHRRLCFLLYPILSVLLYIVYGVFFGGNFHEQGSAWSCSAEDVFGCNFAHICFTSLHLFSFAICVCALCRVLRYTICFRASISTNMCLSRTSLNNLL